MFVTNIKAAGMSIYPDIMPEGATTAIVYTALGGEPDYTHQGKTKDTREIYQFACYANTNIAAKALLRQLEAALNIGISGVAFIEQMNEAIKDYEEDTSRHAYKVDYKFYYEK